MAVDWCGPSTGIDSFQRVVDGAKVHLGIVVEVITHLVTNRVRTSRSISTWSDYRRERENSLIILEKLLNNIMDERLLASNDLCLLVLCNPNGKLLELLDNDVPVLSLAH